MVNPLYTLMQTQNTHRRRKAVGLQVNEEEAASATARCAEETDVKEADAKESCTEEADSKEGCAEEIVACQADRYQKDRDADAKERQDQCERPLSLSPWRQVGTK